MASFREFELCLQTWQHYETIFWSRFSFYLTLLVIGGSGLIYIFIQPPPEDIIRADGYKFLLLFLSLALGLVSLFWLFPSIQQQYWIHKYKNLAKMIQDELCKNKGEEKEKMEFGIIFPPLKYAKLNVNLPTFGIVNLIILSFTLFFFAEMVYFYSQCVSNYHLSLTDQLNLIPVGLVSAVVLILILHGFLILLKRFDKGSIKPCELNKSKKA